MPDLPIWVWVVSVLGVFAAGIGLGLLIIVLFWRIERYLFPAPAVRREIKKEVQVIDPVPPPVPPPPPPPPEPPPVPPEAPIIEKETIEIVKEEAKEEIAPVIAEPIYVEKSEENRLIKFATILRPRFNHPFREAHKIICWDIALQNGDEITDTEGNVMKLRVVEPPGKTERKQYFLSDESGQQTISLVHGKEYVKKETTLDFDKFPKPR